MPPLLNEVLENTVKKLERLSSQCLGELGAAGSAFRKAMVTARAIDALNAVLTPDVMKHIMSLMNTPLGFLTDLMPGNKKNLPPYSVEIVKRAVIEALLNGVDWTGNQFNIIAGRMYITQTGYRRKCLDVAGLTDLEEVPGVPANNAGGQMCCRVLCRWKLDGVQMELTDQEGKPGMVFPLITNDYMSPDALIGKAKRKALKVVFERATGNVTPDDDHLDSSQTDQTNAAMTAVSKTESLVDKLKNRAASVNGNHAAANDEAAPADDHKPMTAAQESDAAMQREQEAAAAKTEPSKTEPPKQDPAKKSKAASMFEGGAVGPGSERM